MSKIYFTSDLHFSHKNIIEYCNRPFGSVQQMNDSLIFNWNKKVKPEDTVYLLGDIFFCRAGEAVTILNQLNGAKKLVLGNHDNLIRENEEVASYFQLLPDLHQESIDGLTVVMSHYPMLSWNRAFRGSFMLHGHVHSAVANSGNNRRYDVGVDGNEYSPVSWDFIKKRLLAIEPVDGRDR